ncbi:hypothetical protein [Nocardioides sp. B-3]|uniref:hypothetical protein n=1 Tax=Nocardioides sp. B-3 TaxID=2895565 RepID=UPI0021531504|nr:hypothetical protein [Nocardioides sp. B-3]UUZ58095.1 hypothetical protein LP418_17640 [Nocardioides sp. B-3]
MSSGHRFPPGWPLPPDQPFTLEQARAAGVSRALPALLRSRVVRRPLWGVYVSTAVPDSIVLRATCVALVMPAGCFVTDRCAGWLHGADMTLAPNEDVPVPRVTFFRPSDEGRLRNGLCLSGERHVQKDELTEIHGILATTQLRTALDPGSAPAAGCGARRHGFDGEARRLRRRRADRGSPGFQGPARRRTAARAGADR